MCRASFSKNEVGKQKNKGINFKISKTDIEKLFDKVLTYDTDQKTILINSEFIFQNEDILDIGDHFEKTKYLDGRVKE